MWNITQRFVEVPIKIGKCSNASLASGLVEPDCKSNCYQMPRSGWLPVAESEVRDWLKTWVKMYSGCSM